MNDKKKKFEVMIICLFIINVSGMILHSFQISAKSRSIIIECHNAKITLKYMLLFLNRESLHCESGQIFSAIDYSFIIS